MSDCGCSCTTDDDTKAPQQRAKPMPWYRDRMVLIPLGAGLLLLVGWCVETLGSSDLSERAALVLFAVSLLVAASQFAPEAVQALVSKRSVGISLLMTIGAVGAVALGYFAEAATLAFLYSITEALESKAMQRARYSLRALLDLMPASTLRREAGSIVEIATEAIRPGDQLVIPAGQRVPTDGIVLTDRGSVDTSAITGESVPVDVSRGTTIAAGAISLSGSLDVEATAGGTDNSLTTIVELVEQAQNDKGARARMADRIAAPLVPGVLVLSALIAVFGSVFGDPMVWIHRALVVLVAVSPCALAISVPVTVVSAIGAASRFGLVISSGAAFERLGNLTAVAIDKTGTLTRNKPVVVDVLTAPGIADDVAVRLAAAVEIHSSHPFAAAITQAAAHSGASSPALPPATDIRERAGHSISAVVDGSRITVGSAHLAAAATQSTSFSTDVETRLEEWRERGISPVCVVRDDAVIAILGLRDELRPEAAAAVQDLRGAGIRSVMLTGDNRRTACAIASAAGISEVHADLAPAQKAAIVTELARSETVAMIGDGINDAPALAAADVGIAMGVHGSDVAVQSADIAFTGADLRLIPRAVDHARRARRIMVQNIAVSLVLVVGLLPFALSGVLGLAAVVAVHEGAEVIVILNGLRAARVPVNRQVPALDSDEKNR